MGRDLWIALAIGVLVGVLATTTSLINGGPPFLWPLATLTATLAIGVWVAERWLADRLLSSDYGELVGLVDPDQQAALLPYHVITLVSFSAAIVTTITAVVINRVEAAWLSGVLYGATAFCCTWALVGFLELVRITYRHQRRLGDVQNMRRRLEAQQRGGRRS